MLREKCFFFAESATAASVAERCDDSLGGVTTKPPSDELDLSDIAAVDGDQSSAFLGVTTGVDT